MLFKSILAAFIPKMIGTRTEKTWLVGREIDGCLLLSDR